jgi:GMP synthase (glutamine-hydrolysing)
MRLLAIENERGGTLGSLVHGLSAGGTNLQVWRAWAGAQRPAGRHDGVIALGGAVNVDDGYEKAPWLAAERRFLSQCLDDHVPVLGICLGAQLLCQVSGGSVFASTAPELGWTAIQTTSAAATDRLLAKFPGQFAAFEWHFYRMQVPGNAIVLAASRAGVQAFRLGTRCWGLQFHLEAEPKMIDRWLREDAGDLVRAGASPFDIRVQTRLNVASSRTLAESAAESFRKVALRAAVGSRLA